MHTIVVPVAMSSPSSVARLAASSRRIVSLDVLRGLAILLMIFSGMIPKTLPNWMDHGYQPHYRPDASGAWRSALDPGGDAVFDGRWKAMTWVDLVFPMFLFSMGAALPMAMGRRVSEGGSKLALLRTIVGRFLMLVVFAVLIDNINPPSFDAQDENARRLLVLAGFVVVFLFYVRWNVTVPAGVQRSLRWATGLTIALLVAAYAVQRNQLAAVANRPAIGFTWGRSDTIILVLANCYLVAAILWLFTARVRLLRLVLAIPFMFVAHYLAISPKTYPDWLWIGDWSTHSLFRTTGGGWTLYDVVQSPKRVLDIGRWIAPMHAVATTRPWLARLLDLSPLWDFTWYKYLWLVIPGTLVGDWVSRWSRQTRPLADASPRVDVSAVSGTAIDSTSGDPIVARPLLDVRAYPATLVLWLTIALTAGVCCGLRHYGYPTLGIGGPLRTPYLALTLGVPVLAAIAFLVTSRSNGDLWLLRRLCWTGAAFLTIGLTLACVPLHASREGWLEGGISKGPPATLSYYFVAGGLCMLLLMGLLGVLDLGGRPRRRLGLVEANGQNPLLVYFLAHVVTGAIFGLTLFAPFHAGGTGWWSHVQTFDDLGRTDRPWLGALWGAFKTLLLAAVTWICTRRKIYWRA